MNFSFNNPSQQRSMQRILHWNSNSECNISWKINPVNFTVEMQHKSKLDQKSAVKTRCPRLDYKMCSGRCQCFESNEMVCKRAGAFHPMMLMWWQDWCYCCCAFALHITSSFGARIAHEKSPDLMVLNCLLSKKVAGYGYIWKWHWRVHQQKTTFRAAVALKWQYSSHAFVSGC